MGKMEICRKMSDLGKFGRRTLVYSLTEDTTENGKEYGVCVEMAETGETAEVRRVTPGRNRAERLLDILATNFVTPVSLEDVVDDWLIM